MYNRLAEEELDSLELMAAALANLKELDFETVETALELGSEENSSKDDYPVRKHD